MAHTNPWSLYKLLLTYLKKKKKNLSTPEHLWKIYKEEGRGEVRVLNSSFKSEEKKP